MVKSIGAEGYVGIALEAVSGTYEVPTKFFPIRGESLAWTQDTNWRRVIRGTADVIGAVAGNGHVEGDLDVELLSDVLPYFMRCARGTLTQTDTAGAAPYTYEFVPAHNAVPPATMSITVVRAGEAFGYSGCVVSSMAFGVDNNMGTMNFTILGTAEADVAVPGAPAYAGDEPFGAGKWTLEIPSATQIFDADNFSLEINDNGTAQNRMKDSLGAQFVSFGEREVTLSVDRDFEDRAEFDAFKALTSKAIRVYAENDAADDNIEFLVPVAIVDSYDVSLGGVGDLVRAGVTYRGTHHADGSFQVTILTTEDLGLVA